MCVNLETEGDLAQEVHQNKVWVGGLAVDNLHHESAPTSYSLKEMWLYIMQSMESYADKVQLLLPVASVGNTQNVFDTLDEALCAFDANRQNQMSHATQTIQGVSLEQMDDINEHLLQMHDTLSTYWSQFGFMNRSKPEAFLKCMHQCILEYPKHEEQDEDGSDIEDEDGFRA